MSRLSPKTYILLLLLSAGIWAVIAGLCTFVGTTSIGIPYDEAGNIAWSILTARRDIVLHASLVGAALASAGVVYQAVLRNPLADPYLLGVASGATLGSTLWKFPALALLPIVSAIGQQTAALVGALGTVALVFAASTRKGRLEPITLLLTGVIVSSLCASFLLLLVALRPELLAGAGGPTSLLIGGIQSNLSTIQRLTAAVTIGLGFVILLFLSAPLAVATLSDAEAGALGVRIHRLRWAALIVASIVVAAGVAISGPIGFVGLISPHVARMLVGPDPRRHLPVATAIGAALLASADAICRVLAQQQLLSTLLPAGVLTAMLGAPFFLLLLLRDRNREAA